MRQSIKDLLNAQSPPKPRQFWAGINILKALFKDKSPKEIERTMKNVEIVTNTEGAKYIEERLNQDE